MKLTHRLGIVSALALTLASSLSAQSIALDTLGRRAGALEALNVRSTGALVQRAEDSLRLSDVSVASIAAPFFTGAAFDTVAPIDGEAVTLRLTPTPVTSPDFKLMVDMGGGKLEQVDAGPSRTFRGVVLEKPGATVAASLHDDGLYARILLEDGRQFWIEPLATRLPDAQVDDHAVYEGAAVIPSGGTCASEAWAGEVHGFVDRENAERGGACGSGLCIAQVGVDADRLYYISQGSNTTQTSNRIQSIFNSVNLQYERDVQIRHVITTIIIRANDGDIYSNPNASTMLTDLRNEWNANQSGVARDVVHLFTGRDLTGSTIGIAQLGVICNLSVAYGLVQPTCCGSFGCQTDLSAHELGHNWNAPHCSCPQHTMNPSLVCRNVFSNDSIGVISSFRNSRGCLAPSVLPPPPAAFSIVSPSDNSVITDTSPLLDWEPSDGAVTYTVRWADNPSLTGASEFSVSVSQLVTSNNTFQDGTTYYWSVTANGQFGGSTPSIPALASFTVNTSAPPPCAGDTNGDQVVNGADLSVLLGQFGQGVPAGTGADFNGDGIVNGADLSVLLSRFNSAC